MSALYYDDAVAKELRGIHQCLRELVDIVKRDMEGMEAHRAQHPEAPTVNDAGFTPSVKVGP